MKYKSKYLNEKMKGGGALNLELLNKLQKLVKSKEKSIDRVIYKNLIFIPTKNDYIDKRKKIFEILNNYFNNFISSYNAGTLTTNSITDLNIIIDNIENIIYYFDNNINYNRIETVFQNIKNKGVNPPLPVLEINLVQLIKYFSDDDYVLLKKKTQEEEIRRQEEKEKEEKRRRREEEEKRRR